MSELTMSMFANSNDYWKARCENAEDQLAALKEENERLKEIEHRVWHLLDEAIDDGSGELKISIHNNVDLDELNKLLPDDCHEAAGERLSIRAERDQLKARVAELEAITGSGELWLVLKNYMNITLVPEHYRICKYILEQISKKEPANEG